jgi:hypothetical protein
MAQAVSRRPLTAEGRARSQVSPCEIYGGQSSPGTGFSPVLVFAQSFYRCSVLTFIYTLLLPGQTGETWGPSKTQYFFGSCGVFGMIKTRMRLAALKEINLFWKLRGVWEGLDWIQPAEDGNKPSGSTKCRCFNDRLRHYFLLKKEYDPRN